MSDSEAAFGCCNDCAEGVTTMSRRDFPRVSRYCRCGAQWHGRYAVEATNSVLTAHAQRCGPPVSEERFEALGHRPKPPASWRSADRESTR